MTWQRQDDGRYSKVSFTCLSSDTKETTGVEPGDIARETDTGDKYEFNGSTWDSIGTNGEAHVRAMELGIETFSGVIVSPGVTSIPFVTIPAGCHTLLLSPVKASLAAVSGWIALTEAVGIAVNTDASLGSIAQGQYILQLEDPDLRIGVNPGDQVEFICSATGAGQLIAKYLG